MAQLETLSPDSIRRIAEMLRRQGYAPINTARPREPEQARSGPRVVRIARTTVSAAYPSYPLRPANTYVIELGSAAVIQQPGLRRAWFTPYSPAQKRIGHDFLCRWLPPGTVVLVELHHGQWWIHTAYCQAASSSSTDSSSSDSESSSSNSMSSSDSGSDSDSGSSTSDAGSSSSEETPLDPCATEDCTWFWNNPFASYQWYPNGSNTCSGCECPYPDRDGLFHLENIVVACYTPEA